MRGKQNVRPAGGTTSSPCARDEREVRAGAPGAARFHFRTGITGALAACVRKAASHAP